MSRVTILVGLPGSGKSTIAKHLYEVYGAKIVCPDTIRKELTGDEGDQSRNTEVFRIAENQIYEAVAKREDVIYDATNVHRFGRMVLIQKIRKCYEDCIIDCIIVAPNIDEVRYRNNNRERKVPDEVINRMLSNWETPMEFEGFNNIYINHAGDENYENFRADRRVKRCYLNKPVYEGEFEKTNQYHRDLMRVIIESSNIAEYRWDNAMRDEVLVASAFVHCGVSLIPEVTSEDAHRHIGAYVALTYCYDKLMVNPVYISYLVESHEYGPEEWIRWDDIHAYSCVEELHSACVKLTM